MLLDLRGRDFRHPQGQRHLPPRQRPRPHHRPRLRPEVLRAVRYQCPAPEIRLRNRAGDSRIYSADLIQMNGRGLLFHSAIRDQIADPEPACDLVGQRVNRRRVSATRKWPTQEMCRVRTPGHSHFGSGPQPCQEPTARRATSRIAGPGDGAVGNLPGTERRRTGSHLLALGQTATWMYGLQHRRNDEDRHFRPHL